MNRKRQASAVSGGIMLIGMGVLFMTDWFWPGMLLVVGLSGGAERILRGKTSQGLGTMAFFGALTAFFVITQSMDVNWSIIGPFMLIAIGTVILVKTLFQRGDPSSSGAAPEE